MCKSKITLIHVVPVSSSLSLGHSQWPMSTWSRPAKCELTGNNSISQNILLTIIVKRQDVSVSWQETVVCHVSRVWIVTPCLLAKIKSAPKQGSCMSDADSIGQTLSLSGRSQVFTWLVHHHDQTLFSPKCIAMDHSADPTHWPSSSLSAISSLAERSFSSFSSCKAFLSWCPHLLSTEMRSSRFRCVVSSCFPEAANPKTVEHWRIWRVFSGMF